jgi:anti-sigma regulatory factor (Ser/Thr protein kinase)
MALSPSQKGGRCLSLLEIDGRVTTSEKQNGQGAGFYSPRSELLLQLHLESNPEALTVVRAAVHRAAEVLHFEEHEARAIMRAVDEALANIIRHAYRGRQGFIDVNCSRLWKSKDAKTPSGIEVILADSGDEPDPRKLQGRPLEEVRPGGLGLYFIKQSMDVVEFSRRDGKNFLRLVKYLTPKPEQMPEGE